MNPDFDQFENDRMVNDPTNYKWGLFYFNPKDSRVLVAKRNWMMGWTLNFAKPISYMIILGFIAFALIFGQLVK